MIIVFWLLEYFGSSRAKQQRISCLEGKNILTLWICMIFQIKQIRKRAGISIYLNDRAELCCSSISFPLDTLPFETNFTIAVDCQGCDHSGYLFTDAQVRGPFLQRFREIYNSLSLKKRYWGSKKRVHIQDSALNESERSLLAKSSFFLFFFSSLPPFLSKNRVIPYHSK